LVIHITFKSFVNKHLIVLDFVGVNCHVISDHVTIYRCKCCKETRKLHVNRNQVTSHVVIILTLLLTTAWHLNRTS